MTNGSCHSTQESNVQTWLKPPRSARAASSVTRLHGGFVCSTKPISINPPSSQVLALTAGQEPSPPRPAVPLSAGYQHLTAGKHRGEAARNLPALVGGVVHGQGMGPGGQAVPEPPGRKHDGRL